MAHESSYEPTAKLPRKKSRWLWEIDAPMAACLIEVVDVFWNGEEWWVETENVLPRPFPQLHPHATLCVNDLGRFWEAVTPVGGPITKRFWERITDPSTRERISA